MAIDKLATLIAKMEEAEGRKQNILKMLLTAFQSHIVNTEYDKVADDTESLKNVISRIEAVIETQQKELGDYPAITSQLEKESIAAETIRKLCEEFLRILGDEKINATRANEKYSEIYAAIQTFIITSRRIIDIKLLQKEGNPPKKLAA